MVFIYLFVTFTLPFTFPSLRLLPLFASLSLYPYIQPLIHTSIPSVHTCIHSHPSLSSLRVIRLLIDVNKVHDMVALLLDTSDLEVTVIL
jgi:hypothetical protein